MFEHERFYEKCFDAFCTAEAFGLPETREDAENFFHDVRRESLMTLMKEGFKDLETSQPWMKPKTKTSEEPEENYSPGQGQ